MAPGHAKIVLLTSTMSPGAGGLAASVPNLASALDRIGHEGVHVVGLRDIEAGGTEMTWGSTVHALRRSGPQAFGYAASLKKTLIEIAPDLVDVQGLWKYHTLASLQYCQKTNTPYIVTPRGMLDPWALKRSRIKKWIARLIYEDSSLRHASCLRATSEMEAEHFRNTGLTNPIAIVPNGVNMPQVHPSPYSHHGTRKLLFLSRIHPKKGLRILLRAWSNIAPHRPDWELIIAGPDERGHLSAMQRFAQRLAAQRVTWKGAVYGDEKAAAYREAELFVLPTHAENFGLVIAEALAHGTPVITTRCAPWSGLRDEGCGWWIELSGAALEAALLEATSLPRRELELMGERGRDWVSEEFDWDVIAKQMQGVYRWVLGQDSRPDYVLLD